MQLNMEGVTSFDMFLGSQKGPLVKISGFQPEGRDSKSQEKS